MYDLIDPPVDYWKQYGKPELIENVLIEVCADIAKNGELTTFKAFFDYLYEKVEENLDDFREVECESEY